MATEEKKYLVNVESNLDKYAKDAAKAREEVERLTIENLKMQSSDKATTAEKEKTSAALRNAQKEYRDAKKAVDLQTQANNSNINSRKQLNAIVTLEQKRLGALANTYTINEKGVRELSKGYIEQVKRLSEAKEAVIKYDKAQKDGRTSVGLYTEAIEESSSKFGNLGASLEGVGTKLKESFTQMIAGGAAIAGIAVIFSKLKDAIMSTSFAVSAMNTVAEVSSQIFYDVAINAQFSWKNIKTAFLAAEEFNDLRVEQYEVDLKLSRIQREINALMLDAADTEKSAKERLSILTRVRELDTEQTVIETDALKKQLKATYDLLQIRGDDEVLQKQLYALQIQIEDAYAKSDQAMRRVESQRVSAARQLNTEKEKGLQAEKDIVTANKEAEKKRIEIRDKKAISDAKELQALKDKNIKEIESLQKLINNDLLGSEKRKQIKLDELQFSKDLQKDTEDLTANQIKADNIATEIWIQNRDRAADALGALSAVLGEETEAGKLFAVAQATINTWVAASMTLRDPTIPSTFARIAAMVSIILTGLATVKNIMKVDTSGGSAPAPSSIPTSISSTPAAQRTFASPVGSSFFTQPQLTQPQLNAVSQGNLLTAADIANAISKLPNPIVSVEAYENVAKAKTKVEVRAII